MIVPESQNRTSRKLSSVTLAAGGTHKLYVGGDFFRVYSMTGATASQLEIRVNGDDWTPCEPGLLHQGVVGNGDVQQVEFRNPSAGSIALKVIHGKGREEIVGQVAITNPQFNLDPGDVAAITPPAETLAAGGDNLSDEVKVYTGLRSITVINTGGINITVNGVTWAPGYGPTFSTSGRMDVLGQVTVDCTGGGSATTITIS